MAERLTLDQETELRELFARAQSAPGTFYRIFDELDALRAELAASEQALKTLKELDSVRHNINDEAVKQLAERDSRIAELEADLSKAQGAAIELAKKLANTRDWSKTFAATADSIDEEKAQLQQDVERLVGALQRLVKTCPRGCSDGKIGNAESSYMECPACGPLRQALSAPSAQQAQQRIAAMEELEAAVWNATQYVGTDSGLSPTTGEMERLAAALQQWRETR